jgi:hypothetical protein
MDGHVPDDTTPAPEGDQNQAPQENWQERYTGLQKIVAKRDEALHTTTATLDALRAEHEAALAELSEHRQKQVDASEEETARHQYDQLKARFEAPPPVPAGTNAPRGGDWTAPEGSKYATRERTGTSTGWPT